MVTAEKIFAKSNGCHIDIDSWGPHHVMERGRPGVQRLNRPTFTRLLILSIAGLSVFVFACGGGGAKAPEAAEPAGHHAPVPGEDLPIVVLPARWAWGDAEHLGTLISSADVVFRGTVVALRSQTPVGGEAAADGPRWADFPVSQFDVGVESVISGNLAPVRRSSSSNSAAWRRGRTARGSGSC